MKAFTTTLLIALLVSAITVDSNGVPPAEVTKTVNEAEAATTALEKSIEASEIGVKSFLKLKNVVNDIGPVLSVIGWLYKLVDDSDQATRMLISKEFQEVNRRVDMLEWKIDDIVKKISTESEKMTYNEQFLKIVQLDEAKKRYQASASVTTLENLRQQCKSSNPDGVIDILHTLITTSHVQEDFLGTIFESVEYGQIQWLTWCKEISDDFMKAMVLQQVCLGVRVNKDKSQPTKADMEFFKTTSMHKFQEVMAKLEEKYNKIDKEWYNSQLSQDVERVVTTLGGGKSRQQVAEAVFEKLKSKYTAYFGVTVHGNTDVMVSRILNPTFSKTFTPRNSDNVVVINWSPGGDTDTKAHSDQVNAVINQIGNGFKNCTTPDTWIIDIVTHKDWKPDDKGRSFLDYFLVANKNRLMEINFDSAYALITKPSSTNLHAKDVFGIKYDHANTASSMLDQCNILFGHFNCLNPSNCPVFFTTLHYGMYAVFGFQF